MKTRWQVALRSVSLVSLTSLASLASAHHSYAMFDRAEVTLTGTVKEFQWTNPHVWIVVNAADGTGQVSEWGIETASPNMLKSAGWRAKSLKTGDKVVALIHPKRNGAKEGSLIQFTLEDGSVLKVRDLVAAPLLPGAPPAP